MCIKLVKLPKILPIMRKMAPDAVICGFKLLVDSTEEELIAAMTKQVEETKVDVVIGNDLRDIKADDHKLLIMSRDREQNDEDVLHYSWHEVKQPSKAERTPKTANCLAWTHTVPRRSNRLVRRKRGAEHLTFQASLYRG